MIHGMVKMALQWWENTLWVSIHPVLTLYSLTDFNYIFTNTEDTIYNWAKMGETAHACQHM